MAEAVNKTILLLNWRDKKNPLSGGAEVFAFEIAKRLTRDGYHVIWFANQEKGLKKQEIYDGIEIVRQGSWKTVYAWAFFYYIFKFRKKVDFIIDCQNGIPFFTPLYSFKPKVCVIHHVHREVFKHFSPSLFIKYVGIFLESLMPFIYKKTKVVTVSPSTKLSLESLGFKKEQIEIVYNGINLETFLQIPKTKQPSLLYLGRLKKYKKIDDLLYAFKEIKAKIPDTILTIAGIGEELVHLKKIAEELNLEHSIAFKGFITEEEKRTLLAKSWLLVYPSTHEGWGISVIEANASATIAVASNVAGLRDAVRDSETGLLFNVGDRSDLAKKISYIINEPEKRIKMEHEALLWANQFSWDKSYEAFRDIINR